MGRNDPKKTKSKNRGILLHQGFTNRCGLLGWPIAPSYMSPNAGGGWELRSLSQWVQVYTGAQMNFGDLIPYLTYVLYTFPLRWQRKVAFWLLLYKTVYYFIVIFSSNYFFFNLGKTRQELEELLEKMREAVESRRSMIQLLGIALSYSSCSLHSSLAYPLWLALGTVPCAQFFVTAFLHSSWKHLLDTALGTTPRHSKALAKLFVTAPWQSSFAELLGIAPWHSSLAQLLGIAPWQSSSAQLQ
jgi:hypothetical protein